MHVHTPIFPPDIVRASAGAGKTFELTTRFIQLLAAGELPDRILATTFTRKAAGEIHDRVLTRLADAAADPRKCAELAEHVAADGVSGVPPLTTVLARALLCRLVAHLHRLNICTLDSFFIRIATSFSLELGLPPGWDIVDEVRDRRLRVQAVRAVLNDSDHAALVQFMRLMGGGDIKRAVHDEIMRVVESLYVIYRQTRGEAWHWLSPPKPMSDDRLIDAIAALGAAEGPIPAGAAKAIRKDQEQAMARDWLTFLAKGVAAKVAAGEVAYNRWPIPDDIRCRYQPLIDHARAELLTRLAGQTRATYELLRRYDAEYRRLKLAERVMRFEDVTHELAAGAIAGNTEEIYYRLDGQVSHLLLDEFQDTSLDQWRVLKPIADEVVAVGGMGRSLFCVGDVKQAIYGWRGGVAEIFDALTDEWPHITPRFKNETRRCSQPVIDAVNAVFTNLSANLALARCNDPVVAWSKRFQPHTTASKEPGFARLLVAPRAEKHQPQIEATLAAAALLVRQIVEHAPGYTVGVLTRSNAAVARLIYELRRPEIGIIASEEGGNPLTDSPAVAAVLSLLRMADHPGDTAARFHVAASPLGAVVRLTNWSDDRQAARVAAEVRGELMTRGYGPALFRLAEALAGSCEQRDLNRLLQLVELGHAWAEQATLRPRDFIAMVQATRVADPTASPVRVMTVHQAKGLEFDSVVLPELDKDIGVIRGAMMLCDRADPTAAPSKVVRYPRDELRGLEPNLGRMYDQAVAARVQDDLSAFYVAMTRARHALHMLIAPSPENERTIRCTYGGVLRCALGGGAPAEPRTELARVGDAKWPAMVKEHRIDAASPPPEAVEVKLAPAPLRRRGLLRRSPSSLEGGAEVDMKRLMRLDNTHRSFGSAMHALFQQIEWVDAPGAPAPEDTALAAAVGAMGVALDDVLPQFRECLKHETTRRLLSRANYSAVLSASGGGGGVQVLREHRFVHRAGGTIVSGSFDRFVLVKQGDRVASAHIIDFKTDGVDPRNMSTVDDAVNLYRPQMEAYRRATAALFKLPPECIKATLLFVGPGLAREV